MLRYSTGSNAADIGCDLVDTVANGVRSVSPPNDRDPPDRDRPDRDSPDRDLPKPEPPNPESAGRELGVSNVARVVGDAGPVVNGAAAQAVITASPAAAATVRATHL
jgi:hypothetical protein